jgi:glycosyltransferase involved in cell wall biosynthesis
VLEINAPYTQERIEMQGNTLMHQLAIRKEGKQILFTDRLIVVSSALKDYFAKKYPLQAAKIIITPNAINPDKMAIDSTFVADLKKQYNLNDCIVIGFVGSIFPYHGVDNLIIAFDEIKKQVTKKIKLVIVGDGETLPELKQLTTKLKLNEEVIFTGNVKNNLIYNYISLMDITVMAKSNWYGSPVKIFEYGALAKAIIAPDTIPVKDVMDNMKDGILVNEQKENLVNALLLLITDEEKRQELGLHFKKKIMENHTWDKMAEKALDGLQVLNPAY